MSRSIPIWTNSLITLLQEISEGIVLIAPDPWRVVGLNDPLARWSGWSKGSIEGQTVHSVFVEGLSEELLERVLGSGPVDADVRISVAGGSESKSLRARVCPMTTDERGLIGVIAKLPDDVRAGADTIAVRRDPLTLLPDRAFLLSRMSTLLEGERTADRQFAVLFVDLDNFKRINDRYGHLVGDRVLREVGLRLVNCVRECDHVTRFGGDEFVVLLEQVSGLSEIDPVVARIHDALARPVVMPEDEFTLSVSIGVAEATPYHRTPEDVLRDADREMYTSKRAAL